MNDLCTSFTINLKDTEPEAALVVARQQIIGFFLSLDADEILNEELM
jgi:hypothetical protein